MVRLLILLFAAVPEIVSSSITPAYPNVGDLVVEEIDLRLPLGSLAIVEPKGSNSAVEVDIDRQDESGTLWRVTRSVRALQVYSISLPEVRISYLDSDGSIAVFSLPPREIPIESLIPIGDSPRDIDRDLEVERDRLRLAASVVSPLIIIAGLVFFFVSRTTKGTKRSDLPLLISELASIHRRIETGEANPYDCEALMRILQRMQTEHGIEIAGLQRDLDRIRFAPWNANAAAALADIVRQASALLAKLPK